MLILTFTAGGNRYAVDVARIVELVPKVQLRPIPHAPAFLAGLLGYRGKVVPVIDLGLLLGSAPCQDRLNTRIILVSDPSIDHNRHKATRANSVVDTGCSSRDQLQDQHPHLLGLIAEHVGDLTEVPTEQLVAAPVHLPQAPYLGSIAQTDQGITPLIEVAELSLLIVNL